MCMTAITCQQLCVNYGKAPIVKNVDLHIAPGECFGLVGENGAGKSTLIKSMLDLIAIKSGRCEFFGVSNRIVSSRSRLTFLPDRFVPPYYLKARDFLQYMAALHGLPFNAEKAEEMLRLLDLDLSALDKSVRELSKGMNQKIGLAACFLSHRDILILDEPMSGLDPRARARVKQQILELKRQGKTLFFSSHMLADVEEIADRMAVLHRGEIQFTGAPQAFMQHYQAPTMETAYLACVN
ncbi:MAG: ABC transporter ATP-binding protein [Gammaproteobacteria bacterium]|nr:ABC transporter ATP-binding protein [Gammaproteobacteria bacterium]